MYITFQKVRVTLSCSWMLICNSSSFSLLYMVSISFSHSRSKVFIDDDSLEACSIINSIKSSQQWFNILYKEELHEFTAFLNSRLNSITFSVEKDLTSIPFLDVSIS